MFGEEFLVEAKFVGTGRRKTIKVDQVVVSCEIDVVNLVHHDDNDECQVVPETHVVEGIPSLKIGKEIYLFMKQRLS